MPSFSLLYLSYAADVNQIPCRPVWRFEQTRIHCVFVFVCICKCAVNEHHHFGLNRTVHRYRKCFSSSRWWLSHHWLHIRFKHLDFCKALCNTVHLNSDFFNCNWTNKRNKRFTDAYSLRLPLPLKTNSGSQRLCEIRCCDVLVIIH